MQSYEMPCIFLVTLFCLLSRTDIISANPYRLPTSVKPLHYEIELEPNFYNKTPQEFMLYGRVVIDAEVLSATNFIRLHAVNLTIKTFKIFRNGIDLFNGRIYDRKRQWFHIILKDNLRKGEKIRIIVPGFKRRITHSLTGLYYYTREVPVGKGNFSIEFGVTTQLEATYAREMFPCFDEPAMKARFKISIRRMKPYFSLSNMPIENRVPLGNTGWIVDQFKTTPIMSTYLLAVIVTQYKCLSEMHRNVNFSIYYPAGMENDVQLAMTISRKVFSELEDYFDVKYPISKLDQIAFSGDDFHYGGMENYGMITYQDTYLYETPNMPVYNKYIAGVVLHEITHQWFGNLVTMNWWDDLWLNEGMTEYFSFIRGKWIGKYKTIYAGFKRVLIAMASEIHKDMPPVYVPWAKSPKEILSVINGVTYSKGAMLIKMAEKIIGENVFKAAMRSYIKNNLYGNVGHRNLLQAFTEADKDKGGANMERILSPWLMQPGFPVVNVTFDYKNSELNFQQSPFFKTAAEMDATMPVPSKYKYIWPLPLQWKTGNHGKSKVFMRYNKTGSVKIEERLYSNDWIIVNPEINFYYIVSYDKSHWRKIGRQLLSDHLAFDQLTRVKLVFDLMNLYSATKSKKGDYVDHELVNEILRYAKFEKGDLALAFLRGIFRSPGYDRKLKPIRDILVQRKLLNRET